MKPALDREVVFNHWRRLAERVRQVAGYVQNELEGPATEELLVEFLEEVDNIQYELRRNTRCTLSILNPNGDKKS